MHLSISEQRRVADAIRRATLCVKAARVELALAELHELLTKANFNPNQPRVPAGNPDGGQWTDDSRWSGGWGSDRSRWVRIAQVGGSSPVLSDATPQDEWKPGAQYAQYRPPRGQFPGATPGQNARLGAAELREFSAVRQVQQVDPNWKPRSVSATAPGSIEGEIARAEARASEAEARLRELARQPHERLLEMYRERNAPPDLFRQTWSQEQHTVAVCTPGGPPTLFFGMNSGAPTYTGRDRAVAQRTVDLMIEQFPETMDQLHIGRWPNFAIYHAESTIALRMRDHFGGTLAGRDLRITLDKATCPACVEVLPSLGMHLGNPRITWFDPLGFRGIMQDGRWHELRPRQ